MKSKFYPLVFLFFVGLLIMMFLPLIFGSMETQANMTGSEYEEDYIGLTGLIMGGNLMVLVFLILIVIAILIIAFMKMKRAV